MSEIKYDAQVRVATYVRRVTALFGIVRTRLIVRPL